MNHQTSPEVRSFFDKGTSTASHVVSCPVTHRAAIIDSVLSFDQKSGRTSTAAADEILRYIRENGLAVDWHLETHVHADHFSAAPYLKKHLGGQIGIGRAICQVQSQFKWLFNAKDMSTEGEPFDKLFDDAEELSLGCLSVRIIHTPGHTPACITYLIGQDAFVGDTLFMPDYGTARCDFPGGDAGQLFRSVQKILALPPETRLHLCHDYAPGGRAVQWVTTVGEQRMSNIHVRDGIDEAAFVEMRTSRDRGLEVPMLMLPAVQVNARGGNLPPTEDNGVSYLKIPINII